MTYYGLQPGSSSQSSSLSKAHKSAFNQKRSISVPHPEDICGALDYGESRIHISEAYYDEAYDKTPHTKQPGTSFGSSKPLPPHPAPRASSSPTTPRPGRRICKKLSNFLSHCPHLGTHWLTGTSINHNDSGSRIAHRGAVFEAESTTQILSYSIPSTYSRLLPLDVAQKRDDIVHRPEGYEMKANRTV